MNSELGLDVGQANELKMAFRRNNWTKGMIKTLCEGDNLVKVKDFLFLKNDDRKVFPVKIDYRKSVEEMICAYQYDWCDDNFIFNSKNFPISGKNIVKIELELLHFNRCISSKEALIEIESQGYRPAAIEEIFAFGEMFPEVQKKFPIVALGPSWHGCNYDVPCLYCYDGDSRGLDLFRFDTTDWSNYWRFLVVLK